MPGKSLQEASGDLVADLGDSGKFRAVENPGQVIIVGILPFGNMHFRNNAPEVFLFEFVVVGKLDKETYYGLSAFEIYFDGVFC